MLRDEDEITSPGRRTDSGHFRKILKSKNLEIVHYYCAFYSSISTEPNLNPSTNSVKLFLLEP